MGGGCSATGRRTSSALTSAEAQALFLVAGPASPAAPELKSALRKLVRALPEPFRAEAIAASTAVVVEPQGWDNRMLQRPPPPLLDDVQRAVVTGRQVRLGYVARDRSETTRLVHPLGIAAKGPVWYLVGDTEAGLRTFRVDRMVSVELLDSPAVRPAGFELQAAWRMISDRVDELRAPVVAETLVDPAWVGPVRWTFATRASVGPPAPDGRIAVEVRGRSIERLASELAGWGSGVEVLTPEPLRARLATLAAELAGLYA
ncbi:MAG: WYL domain-containing protein [Ilumatobacteraceae bacterium]